MVRLVPPHRRACGGGVIVFWLAGQRCIKQVTIFFCIEKKVFTNKNFCDIINKLYTSINFNLDFV